MIRLARYVPTAILVSVHAAGLALATINPIAPFALIGGAVGGVLIFAYQPFIIVSFTNLSLIKGFLIESVPFFEVVDFSLLLAALSLGAIFWQLVSRSAMSRLNAHGFLLIAYFSWVVWMFIASAYAPDSALGLAKAGRFALFTTILFIGPLAIIGDRRDSEMMLNIFIGYGLFAAVLMFARLYGFVTASTIDPTTHRLTVLGSNPIAVARILVVAVSMLLAGISRNKYRGKKWLLAVIILFGAAVLTGSRGPIASLIGAWIVLAILHGGKPRQILMAGLASLAVIIGIFLYLAPPELTGRFLNASQGDFGITNQGFASVNTVSSRFNLWSLAITVWSSDVTSFFFGIGTAGYGTLFIREAFLYPHNLPLEVLAEFGIVGAIVFLWQIVLVLPQLLSGTKRKLSTEAFMWQAAIFTYFITTFFSGDLNDNRTLWFLVAGFMATQLIDRRSGPEQFEA